ncbi:MAG TPA: exosortase/archaeosortase family protein [Gemmatimonadales bacterium]|nr:exosortase/archaeosortase family protein [Gemmatimonadales bacterium]
MATSLGWTYPEAVARLKAIDAATIFTVAAFVVLFQQPATTLARDWWSDPEAGHGLLLGPLAVWFAVRSWPAEQDRHGRPLAGAIVLVGAVLLRFLSGLAAELFTMRLSMVGALLGLTLYYAGWQQVRRWWLPFSLFLLAIPLPALITNSLALPLQLRASAMGAWLLERRHVPVTLTGNILLLPGHRLFVTEACSGLRSLTALIGLAVLAGGLWLTRPMSRVAILLLAIPIAMCLNAVRIFLTGFLVFYVDPSMGDGFMHMTEGWLMFLVAFICLGGVTWVAARLEARRAEVALAE